MQSTASASAPSSSNEQKLLEAQGRLSSAGVLWTTTRTWWDTPDEHHATIIQSAARGWLARLHERRVGEKRPKSARHKHHNK